MLTVYKAKNYIWMKYSDMISSTDDDEFIPILIETLKSMNDVKLVFDVDSKAYIMDQNLFNTSSLGTNPDFAKIVAVLEVALTGLHKMFGRNYELALKGSRVDYIRYETLYHFEKETGLSFKNNFEQIYTNDSKAKAN